VDPDGQLVGMLTDRDICMAAHLRGQLLSDIKVEQAMAQQVYACSPGDPIGVAERIMIQYQVRRVPVADSNGRVVGLLSLIDLAREAEQQNGRRLPQVTEAEVARTLASVCEPRLDEMVNR
jgi:signal-transduction protein with cAMP-binding, CBS, and nucleotidyltransferase domain